MPETTIEFPFLSDGRFILTKRGEYVVEVEGGEACCPVCQDRNGGTLIIAGSLDYSRSRTDPSMHCASCGWEGPGWTTEGYSKRLFMRWVTKKNPVMFFRPPGSENGNRAE